MKAKHQKTIATIFKTPAQAGIPWKDIEASLIALGAEITEGNGSRVRVKLNGSGLFFINHIPEKKPIKVL
jgi:hypothetical protein